MMIVIINGSAEAGKDSFVEFVSEEALTVNISTVYPVKEAMLYLGWEGEKSESSRAMMSEIKNSWTKHMDGSFKYVLEIIEQNSFSMSGFIFIHAREPEEIKRFVKHFGKKVCKTLLIRRDEAKAFTNGADELVENYDYDFIIDNNGSLEELAQKAVEFATVQEG